VPEDLRALVGKREEKRSLQTRDPFEAERRHAEALAEIELRWAIAGTAADRVEDRQRQLLDGRGLDAGSVVLLSLPAMLVLKAPPHFHIMQIMVVIMGRIHCLVERAQLIQAWPGIFLWLCVRGLNIPGCTSGYARITTNDTSGYPHRALRDSRRHSG
jgi:hypothetical protein